LAGHQRPKVVHGRLQRLRQRRPEERDADAVQALVRVHLDRDELACTPRRWRLGAQGFTHEPVAGGRGEDACPDVGDLHWGAPWRLGTLEPLNFETWSQALRTGRQLPILEVIWS